MIDPNAPALPQKSQSGVEEQPAGLVGPEEVVSQPAPVREADIPQRGYRSNEQPVMPVVETERLVPSVEYVTGRISEYNKKMDRWKEQDRQSAVLRLPADESEKMVRCFQELQKVLSGYNRLHDILLQQSSMSTGQAINAKDVYGLQQSDIAFLDSSCGQLVAADEVGKGAGWLKSPEQGTLAPVEAVIAQQAASGQFEELVQTWRQMPEATAARVQLSTRILYGNALMSLQQEEEAAKVYRQIVDRMTTPDGQPADLLSLRKILADLYVASGDYKDAEAQYLEISKEYKNMASIEEWAILQRSILQQGEQGGPELKEYSEILKNYLGFNPARDGYTVVWQADKFLQTYPHSSVASNVDFIRVAAQEQADKWSKNVLTEADVLAGKKQYQDALGKLETVPNTIVNPETQQQITKLTGEIALAEKIESETVKIEKSQDLERRWNEAMGLMESMQYDKAIEVFTSMLDTEYSTKADKKISEASLLAAEAQRREAADLFIRFTKATDVESKKKLLIESRSRLLDILVKYPAVEVTEKVLGNIKRVEKEMNAIDPNLVQQSGRVGGEMPKIVERKSSTVATPETGVTAAPSVPGQGPVLKQD